MRLTWPPEHLPACVHGTAVSVQGQGVLLCGPSGSGKSSIALQLMALGAVLISDDLVRLELLDDHIQLSRPPQTSEPLQIEARGVGLLRAIGAGPTQLALCVDLSTFETSRLPEYATITIAGKSVRQLRKVDNPAFPAMILQYVWQHLG